VRVRIDEARRHDESRRVDLAASVDARRGCVTDENNAVVPDTDVPNDSGCPGPVVDRAAPDEHGHRVLGRGERERGRDDE
jgi:hypothetical protein